MADRRKAARLLELSAECIRRGRDPCETLENHFELENILDRITRRVERIAGSDPARERTYIPEHHDPAFEPPSLYADTDPDDPDVEWIPDEGRYYMQVSDDVYDMLEHVRNEGESFDSALQRLIDEDSDQGDSEE